MCETFLSFAEMGSPMPKKSKLPRASPQSQVRSAINAMSTVQSDMARSVAAARLYIQNGEIPNINAEFVYLTSRLADFQKIYLSSDTPISDQEEEANNYTPEFLNSLTPSGMPPHKLSLKCGAIVMLLRNLDIRKGLCNGTRLIIMRLHERVIDAEILTVANAGDRVFIPRIKLAPSDTSLPFTLQRIQFPLRLSYSMTINKSQGQTFDKLGIFLSAPVFSHGQLYVAFSRARSFTDIHVKIIQSTTQGLISGQYITPNVVFKEVL